MAKHRITVNSVSIREIFGDNWLLKLERAAFGWHYWSCETECDGYEVSVSSDGSQATGRNKYTTYLEFRRFAGYSHNPLFVLTELICKVWSVIRRIITVLAIPFIIFMIAFILLDKVACSSEVFGEEGLFALVVILLAYVCVIVLPTLIIAGLGFLWRKLFRIDEKFKEKLRLYGYDDDLSYLKFANED